MHLQETPSVARRYHIDQVGACSMRRAKHGSPDRTQARRGGAIANLAIRITSPSPEGSIGFYGLTVIGANASPGIRRHRRDSGENLNGLVAIDGRAIAQLTTNIPAPSPETKYLNRNI
jgi:hypothetical protein